MSEQAQERSPAPRQRQGRCLVATWVDRPVYDALHADALSQDRTLAATIRKRLREFYFPPSGNNNDSADYVDQQASGHLG
jgi:hypothetical protein